MTDTDHNTGPGEAPPLTQADAYTDMIALAIRQGWWAVAHALRDDGYDPNVDYLTLLSDWQLKLSKAEIARSTGDRNG